MNLRIKNTKTTIKVLGFYHILGGIIGLWITSKLLWNFGQITGPVLLISLVAIGLYCFSIQIGNLILQGNRMKRGIIYAFILNALQIISFSTGSYQYNFYSGIKGVFGFNLTNGFELYFGAGLSEVAFTVNQSTESIYLLFNVFAIFVVVVINSIYNEKYSITVTKNENKITDIIKNDV